MRHPSATYRRDLKASLCVADTLPEELEPYAAKPYTYLAWVEDQINGDAAPTRRATAAAKTLRPEQMDDARTIVEAAAGGWRGLLNANATGTGKTLGCIIAAKAICLLRGGNTVVVTVDRPAAMTIPMWRSAIASVGDGGLRWIVVSSDGGLKKLHHPNGRPRVNPTVVINDEAHQFRRDSQRTARMRSLNRLDTEPSAAVPFVMSVTATPGHCPTEYRYLSALLAQAHREPASAWAELGPALAGRGLPVAQQRGPWGERGDWGWDERAGASAAVRQKATATVRDWLLRADPPAMLNRAAPWGPAVLEGMPVELGADQRRLYLSEWGDFQREMHMARRGRDKARGLAAITRFRQKAAMLRVDATVERVVADVEDGYQVLVAVEHVTAAAEPIAQALADKGIGVACLYGDRDDLEEQRLLFQRGHAKVAVVNKTSSVSLHAGEHLSDGTRATTVPRRGYFHQPRYSGILAQQMMGRSHRDGQHCDWFLLYGENTIEQDAAALMVDRLVTTATSVDGDTSVLAAIAALFGADWLPDPDKAVG